MKHSGSWRYRLSALFLLVVLALGNAAPAVAQGLVPSQPAQASADEACTNFESRRNEIFGGDEGGQGSGITRCRTENGQQVCTEGQGLLSEIYLYIKEIVEGATEKLFYAFTDSEAYQHAVGGTIVLMIAIFGVAFTIGVMQASFGQVLVRLVKIGIIFTLISPGGWEFFSETMARFFTEGTDDLIKGVIAIGTGVTPPPDATPFYQFDKLAEFIIQPDTLVAILGSLFNGGPFGAVMGGMMIISTWGFVMLLLKSLQHYAIAFVARTLLLGLAPIFFVFLLFEKTKNLFMSWLNAIITLSLKPILLFTFLSFFLVLIETAARDMFSAELCWSEFASTEGTENKRAFWRFVDPETGATINSAMTWEGAIDCMLSGKGECPEFPINILDMLSFLILVYLATRFADSIERIANELGNAFVALDTHGRLDQFLREQGRGGGGLLGGRINAPAERPRGGQQ